MLREFASQACSDASPGESSGRHGAVWNAEPAPREPAGKVYIIYLMRSKWVG